MFRVAFVFCFALLRVGYSREAGPDSLAIKIPKPIVSVNQALHGRGRTSVAVVDHNPVIQKPPPQIFTTLALTTGIWIPQGRNRVLGAHPFVGFSLGSWRGQWFFEGVLEFRFIDSANPYSANYQGQMIQTKHYGGYFMGLNVGYGFMNFKYDSFQLLGSIALDELEVVPEDDNVPNSGLAIDAFSPGVGIGYQHFGKEGGYWGVQVLYHRLTYRNPGGTPLDGNGVTIRISLGLIAEHD
jgi:hypothetical protein